MKFSCSEIFKSYRNRQTKLPFVGDGKEKNVSWPHDFIFQSKNASRTKQNDVILIFCGQKIFPLFGARGVRVSMEIKETSNKQQALHILQA